MRVVKIVALWRTWQVACGRLVRPAQRRAVAHEQGSGAVWQEQALVRIEREGIGPRKPGHEIPKLRAHVEERAVGTVHVVPDPFAGAQVGDRIQRIDRARIRGAGRRRDAERSEPDLAIRGNRVGQGPHIHSELLIDLDRPDPVRHDARQSGRLDHRVMHLRRAIQHALADSPGRDAARVHTARR